MVGLGSPERPIAGIVISRPKSKRPIVIAGVASIAEFFARLPEWPEDAKLVVPDDVRAALVADIADPSRLA
jgi:hypothetical protein